MRLTKIAMKVKGEIPQPRVLYYSGRQIGKNTLHREYWRKTLVDEVIKATPLPIYY